MKSLASFYFQAMLLAVGIAHGQQNQTTDPIPALKKHAELSRLWSNNMRRIRSAVTKRPELSALVWRHRLDRQTGTPRLGPLVICTSFWRV
jgi:hypothetical protein